MIIPSRQVRAEISRHRSNNCYRSFSAYYEGISVNAQRRNFQVSLNRFYGCATVTGMVFMPQGVLMLTLYVPARALTDLIE